MVYNDTVNGVLSNNLNFYRFPCIINPYKKTGGLKEMLVNHEADTRKPIGNVVNCLTFSTLRGSPLTSKIVWC